MGTGPENAVSQVERLHSESAPVLGGRVGDDYGNGRQPPVFNLFSIIKDSHTLKKYRPARNLKKVQITNVLVNCLSVHPLIRAKKIVIILHIDEDKAISLIFCDYKTLNLSNGK